jgi:hypothetical protein
MKFPQLLDRIPITQLLTPLGIEALRQQQILFDVSSLIQRAAINSYNIPFAKLFVFTSLEQGGWMDE